MGLGRWVLQHPAPGIPQAGCFSVLSWFPASSLEAKGAVFRADISPTRQSPPPRGLSNALLTGCMLAVVWGERQPTKEHLGGHPKGTHPSARRCCTNLQVPGTYLNGGNKFRSLCSQRV